MQTQKKIKLAAPVVIVCFLLIANVCFSQTIDSIPRRDSLPQKVRARVAERFPSTRMLHVEYSQVAPYRYAGNPSNAVSPKNKVTNQHLVKVNANVSFVRKQKWMLGATLNYRLSLIHI